MKNAIQKAIEGGYDPVKAGIYLASKGDTFKAQFLIDPLFWQSLGKSGDRDWMNWAVCLTCGTKVPIFRECNCDDDEDTTPEPQMAWEWYWHKFIHHLAEGKDPEDFFTNLLTKS